LFALPSWKESWHKTSALMAMGGADKTNWSNELGDF
jgi:hypothetical protein